MAKNKNVWEKNFASSAQIRAKVQEIFIDKMKKVRSDRLELDYEYLRYYNMWNVTHDDNSTYRGNAKLYIPEVRKNVESQARQLTEAAFPTDDNFDVSPGDTGTPEGADFWKSIMQSYIQKNQLRMKYLVFARQQCLFGTSPVYVPWKKKMTKPFRSVRHGKGVKPKRMDVEIANYPDFVVRDLLKWYALNPKANDWEDDGCFEIYIADRLTLLAKSKRDELFDFSTIDNGNTDAYAQEEMRADVERADTLGINIQAHGYSGRATLKDEDKAKTGLHQVALLHVNMVAPEMCEADEDPDMPIPVQIEIYDNEHVGLVRRNPFFDQRAPYVVGKYILPNADEFYGQGIPKATGFQQYELNSKAEQAMDSVTYSLNPIAIIDPGLAAMTGDFPMEPGAKWFASPGGVKFGSMPDVSQIGYAAMGQIRGQMQEYSDRSPALPPQLMGKSRTATQSELVMHTLSTDNKTFQLQNEIMVLQPMLEKWQCLTEQNVDDDMIIMLKGPRAADAKRILVPRNKMVGIYSFDWNASSSMQNRQIQARQILDLMNIATRFPPGTVKFNFDEAIKFLWANVYDLPNGDKIMGIEEKMKTQDPEVENLMVKKGMPLQVLPNDDDQAHAKAHDSEIQSMKDGPMKDDLIQHTLKHVNQFKKKQELMQQMQQQQQAAIAAQQQQEQAGKPRTSQGSGNRTQPSPNANVGDMASGVRA